MESSVLFVVATPIGNLADLSERAQQVLREVDWIAAEDTRHSKRLLTHYGIRARVMSCHAHNELQAAERILQLLTDGCSVALVSDAGTPLVSDPGARLIQQVTQRGFRVVPIPGASAVLAALSASGFATDRFVFEGFLPRSGTERKRRLEQLQSEPRSVVLFEAPTRVAKTVSELATLLGDRQICVARELTKQFETFTRTDLRTAATMLADGSIPELGEFTLVVAGAPTLESARGDEAMQPGSAAHIEADKTLRVLLEFESPSRASRIAARLFGGSRQQWYRRALALADGNSHDERGEEL